MNANRNLIAQFCFESEGKAIEVCNFAEKNKRINWGKC